MWFLNHHFVTIESPVNRKEMFSWSTCTNLLFSLSLLSAVRCSCFSRVISKSGIRSSCSHRYVQHRSTLTCFCTCSVCQKVHMKFATLSQRLFYTYDTYFTQLNHSLPLRIWCHDKFKSKNLYMSAMYTREPLCKPTLPHMKALSNTKTGTTGMTIGIGDRSLTLFKWYQHGLLSQENSPRTELASPGH